MCSSSSCDSSPSPPRFLLALQGRGKCPAAWANWRSPALEVITVPRRVCTLGWRWRRWRRCGRWLWSATARWRPRGVSHPDRAEASWGQRGCILSTSRLELCAYDLSAPLSLTSARLPCVPAAVPLAEPSEVHCEHRTGLPNTFGSGRLGLWSPRPETITESGSEGSVLSSTSVRN